MFDRNTASVHGGGLYNNASDALVTTCTFTDNVATSDGGGVTNSDCVAVDIMDCTFIGNVGSYGGGLRNSNSDVVVTDCTFAANTALVTGGGMRNVAGSDVAVTNCAFVRNNSVLGGGMYDYDSDATVTNCTFSGNVAATDGGAMYNYTAGTNVVVVVNSILWGNAAGRFGTEIHNNTLVPSISYTCIEGGLNGPGCGGDASTDGGLNIGDLVADNPLFDNVPLFVDITIAAGTTTTVLVIDNTVYLEDDEIEVGLDGVPRLVTGVEVDGITLTFAGDPLGAASTADTHVSNWNVGATDLIVDLHLGALSGCIDMGDDTAVPASVTTDLDGNARISGSFVDMGAYEY
jgi:predicted outer membrane repeat protein